jgi:formate C-acetyltransferase
MNAQHLTDLAKKLFEEERAIKRLDGWFRIKEYRRDTDQEFAHLPVIEKAGEQLKIICEKLPISISKYAVFAGTQRDAFASTYALINPEFKVETFCGYCDPTAVYDDLKPDEEFTKDRIENMRSYDKTTPYVRDLTAVYDKFEEYTSEVAFFVEQVTGHVIPDMRPVLEFGIDKLISDIKSKLDTDNEKQKSTHRAMINSLEAAKILANRYRELALFNAENVDADEKERLLNIANALGKVPAKPAENLFEAIQSFIIMWQVMCLEQAPNPYAFSVGNADRIFEPYRKMTDMSREDTAALLKHFLVFFNVGDRSWAISQNLIIGGRDKNGNDLSNLTSFALFDAYYDMNLPQPILSVKLHENTPDEIYREMGRFFFTPGVLTPSLFNDDAMFKVLKKAGIEDDDLENYMIAGCQEPLIWGKDSGNTTNSWLNLGKILELTLTGGKSAISGKKIGKQNNDDAVDVLKNIRWRFYHNLKYLTGKMADAANGCSKALANLPVPFLSAFMGGIESGYDCRDTENQGTKYNGSGCLIHGNTVVADSFIAIDCLLKERPEDAANLISAVKCSFEGYDELREYLLSRPKFGNNIDIVDKEAVEVTSKTADIVRSQLNYLGNNFRPDFSTPSTHLLYGYWVGALPNGRKSREMLNYGIDPLYGDANLGLGFRTLSTMKLPFKKMCGGCASHIGLDPKYFKGETYEDKGLEFRTKVVNPLFFNDVYEVSPFYVYLNVTTPETLRKVLGNPKKYAPNGVYIMRIHGTFVNFLDLSPAIQQDIITRLDLNSTSVAC